MQEIIVSGQYFMKAYQIHNNKAYFVSAEESEVGRKPLLRWQNCQGYIGKQPTITLWGQERMSSKTELMYFLPLF